MGNDIDLFYLDYKKTEDYQRYKELRKCLIPIWILLIISCSTLDSCITVDVAFLALAALLSVSCFTASILGLIPFVRYLILRFYLYRFRWVL